MPQPIGQPESGENPARLENNVESQEFRFERITLIIGLILEIVNDAFSVAVEEYHLPLPSFPPGFFLVVALAIEVVLQLKFFKGHFAPVLHRLEHDFAKQLSSLMALRNTSISLRALERPPNNRFLRERFDELIHEFVTQLEAIRNQKFIKPMPHFDQLSARVCDGLRESAFCTALPQNFFIFEQEFGKAVLAANYEVTKVKKLPFERVFIFRDLQDIAKAYHTMSEQHSRDITVYGVMRQIVNDALQTEYSDWLSDKKLDFGIWDNAYLMRIWKSADGYMLEFSAEEDELIVARKVVAKLRQSAYGWDELKSRISQPSNNWHERPERLVDYQTPNGPDNADVKLIIELCRDHLKEMSAASRSIAVFGLTKPLIKASQLLAAEQAMQGTSIEIIDIRNLESKVKAENTLAEGRLKWSLAKNWLTFQPERPVSLALGDDVLPNLLISQVPMFFENLWTLLQPGGKFITRTAVILSDIDTPDPLEIEQTLLRLQDAVTKGTIPADILNVSSIYELAWPMLHGKKFYRLSDCSFEFGEWDRFVRDRFSRDLVFLNKLLLSDIRRPHPLRMTSLKLSQIEELASRYFDIVKREERVHSVWIDEEKYRSAEEWETYGARFQNYYAILEFTKLSR